MNRLLILFLTCVIGRTDPVIIKKADGNFKVIETKLREGTSRLSRGQEAIQNHVMNGNQKFEVRSSNDQLGLNKGQTIQVDEYVVKYKYKQ